MAHAFRGYVHRTSSDKDGEITVVFKAPKMYYKEVTGIGELTDQVLFVTVHTEDELHTSPTGGPHEQATDPRSGVDEYELDRYNRDQ